MNPGFVFIFAAIVIVILSVLAYAVLAVFFPEWVGITGKVALNAEKSHRAEETSPEASSADFKSDAESNLKK